MTPDFYGGAAANLGLSTDPINGNRYAFGSANPISFIESDGHYQTYEGSGSSRDKPDPDGHYQTYEGSGSSRDKPDPDGRDNYRIPETWINNPEWQDRKRQRFGDPGFKGLVNFVDGALDCGLGLDDKAEIPGENFAASYALGCGYMKTAEIVGLGKGIGSAIRWGIGKYMAKKAATKGGTSFVKYDPVFAARQILGRSPVTPAGGSITVHAAERIAYGGRGGSPRPWNTSTRSLTARLALCTNPPLNMGPRLS